jgi:hypothetical protein
MMDVPSVSCSNSIGEKWTTVCGKFPKEEVIYFTQVAAIFIIIITCLFNLSLRNGTDTVWATLLSGSIGYLLPAPNIRKKNVTLLPDAPEQQLDEVLSQQHTDELRD